MTRASRILMFSVSSALWIQPFPPKLPASGPGPDDIAMVQTSKPDDKSKSAGGVENRT